MKLVIKKNGKIVSQEEFKDFKLACDTLKQKAWQYRDREISVLPEENDGDIDSIRIAFYGVDKAFVKVYDTEYVFEII